MKQLARAKGCTASQLALAWVLAQGEDIIPIPGTKWRSDLSQTMAAVDLVSNAEELAELAELAELDTIVSPDAAAGLRYPESFMGAVNA